MNITVVHTVPGLLVAAIVAIAICYTVQTLICLGKELGK